MRQTLVIAAALVGLAAPAAAQNFTVPAGDSAFTRQTAQDVQQQHNYLALVPDAVAPQPLARAPHRMHRARALAE